VVGIAPACSRSRRFGTRATLFAATATYSA
jgi:hypothetical protein